MMTTAFKGAWLGSLTLLSAAILPCRSIAGTTFARDALMPCVEKRGVAGVVSILYANGVTELNEVGYADLEAKRPISADQDCEGSEITDIVTSDIVSVNESDCLVKVGCCGCERCRRRTRFFA